MPEFHFVKRDGKLALTGRSTQTFKEWVAKIKDGAYYSAEFKSVGTRPSREQLGYYYAAVIPAMIEWMVEQGLTEIGYQVIAGTRVSLAVNKDNVDRLLKALYAGHAGIADEEVKKSRMSKEEMSKFLKFVRSWGHENSVPIPCSEEARSR